MGLNLLFQLPDLHVMLGYQHENTVLRQAQTVQKRVDGVPAGGLPAPLQPGQRRGVADARAEFRLGHAMCFPVVFHVLTDQYFLHNLFLLYNKG